MKSAKLNNGNNYWYFDETDGELAGTMTDIVEHMIRKYADIPEDQEVKRSSALYRIMTTVKFLISHAYSDGWSEGYEERGKEFSEIIDKVTGK